MKQVLRSCVGLLILSVLGCQSHEQKPSKETGAAGASSQAKPESKFARALEAAAHSAGASANGAKAGPPADGVLEPARADAEAPRGKAPSVKLGGAGTEPRRRLATPATLSRGKYQLEVTLDAGGGQGLPPITVNFDLVPDSADKADTDSQALRAKITSTKVGATGIPPEFERQLATLKGSTVAFRRAKDGGAFGFATELGKGSSAELRDLLEAVAEGLQAAQLPAPSEELGIGAFWMVTSRETMAGFDVVTYSMVKVKTLDDKQCTLDVDARRYVVGHNLPAGMTAGGPPIQIQEVSSAGKSSLLFGVGKGLASEVVTEQAMRLAVNAGPGQQPRVLPVGGRYRLTAVR